MREGKSQNSVYSRHQGLKQASHQTKKRLLLVEVTLTEFLVVESVGAIFPRVAAPRVEVGSLQGVLPADRGPLVAQKADEGRALDESGGRDRTAQAVGERVSGGGPRTPSRATVAIAARPLEAGVISWSWR